MGYHYELVNLIEGFLSGLNDGWDGMCKFLYVFETQVMYG
jgi:hypothetical protein